MAAKRPTRPSTVQQLTTGALTDDPEQTGRLLSELADAIAELQRRIALGQTDELFTSTTPGDVPASGGGTTNFLRADRTWAVAGAGAGVATVTAGSSSVTAAPTSGAVIVDVVPANFVGIPEAGVTNLVTDLAAKVPTSRTLAGTSPILIDGGASADLSANRTISILTSYLAAIAAFLFGTGADGSLVFDGAATILGMVPVANVYTLTRNIVPSSMTVNTGITIKTGGWAILCQGTCTLSGTALIHGNGNDASGLTGGAQNWASASTYLGGGGQGGNGGTGNGANGGVNTGAGVPRRFATGANAGVAFNLVGVAGGIGQGGSGGSSIAGLTSGGAVAQTAVAATLGDPDDLMLALFGRPNSGTQGYGGGSGGGSGAGDSTAVKQGGGGGGGAGWVMVRAKAFAGSGSITSKGGAGANGIAGGSTGGGGGGPGAGLICIAGSGTLPTLDVGGGAGGLGQGATGKDGGAGGSGIIYSLVLAP